jgi:mandelamide amidase
VRDAALVDRILAPRAEPPRDGARVRRLGIPRAGFYADLDPHVASCVEVGLDALADQGFDLVEVSMEQAIELDAECGLPIVIYECLSDVADYISTLEEPYSSLGFGDVVAQVESPDVRNVLETALTGPFTEAEYLSFLATRERIQRLYADVIVRQDLSALVFPTVPLLPVPLGDDAETIHNGRIVDVFTSTIRNTGPGSVAGVPSVSLPLETPPGTLPVGLCLEGAVGGDWSLLDLAERIEEVVG